MKKKKKEDRIHLTDHFTYKIIDNVIYLFEEAKPSEEELQLLFKKVSIIIQDEDVSYINISTKNMEEKKEYYTDLGFSLSYYSIDKLNELYNNYDNKKAYRCYAVMTKKDFLNINKKEEKEVTLESSIKDVPKANKGFISNMFLLMLGIALLCYMGIASAIEIIKLGR